MAAIPTVDDVFRDYESNGVPASGAHKPNKRDIRVLMNDMNSRITSAVASSSMVYGTRSALFANLAPEAGTRAEVRNDSTLAYNGIYAKVGDSGSGSWARVSDLPDDIVRLTVTGGTAEAIEATPTPQLPVTKSNKLYLLRPTATNTGAVTIDDGSGAVPIKTVFGTDLVANSLLVDTENVLVWSTDHYRLIIAASVDASSILADAQAAAISANNSAATIDLPAISAFSFLGDNDAGTARVSLTPAQARARIEVPRFDQLPYYLATEYGVDGGGSDQTTALQDMIDNIIPDAGGTVVLRGSVKHGLLNLSGRHNIRFMGDSGNGTGAAQPTHLECILGAIGINVPAINLKSTFNISFEKLFFHASNAAFDGVLLMYGAASILPGDDSALMSLDDCYLHGNGTSNSKLLWLYGATQGSFERLSFGGKGTFVSMQTSAGVGFCNVHQFRSCNFKPSASNYPIVGSGEGISLIGCNFQASSGDGVGRGWITSINQEFNGISLIGCSCYDVLAAGGIWFQLARGAGLNVSGCNIGGADPSIGGNYGVSLGGTTGGVKGFAIIGNCFRYMTAGILFNGTSGAGTWAQKGWVAGNYCFGGSSPRTVLFSNLVNSQCSFGQNHINGGDLDAGSYPGQTGWPTSASGLAAGTMWNNAGVVNIA